MTTKDENKLATKVTKFRTNYDADFKTTVVKYAIQNSNKAASDHFGINESNIRRWKRLSLKAEFLESTVGRRALVKKSRVRRKATGRARRIKKVSLGSPEAEQQENSNDIDRCSIPECRAISNRTHGKLSMFRLPKDEALRAKWLKSIGKKDWNPSQRAVICEKHFDPSAISKYPGKDESGRRLKSRIIIGSLPTILVPPDMEALPDPVRRRRRGRTKKLIEVRRKRGRRRRTVDDLDSMPLQQRLTAIASATKEEEKPVPTLKSQPLSPTKLKVTRQSTSRAQQKPEKEAAKPVAEEICLRWNTHHTNMQTAFPALLSKEQYCDVTLVAEGKSLKCHKLILSSCSSYFDEVLEKVVPYQHPIIFMKDIPFHIMKALCDFMYVGEVNIVQSDLDQILSVGNSLQIKGLANRLETGGCLSKNEKTCSLESKTKTAQGLEETDPANDTEITDPLDLMEPTYEEAATPDIPPVTRRNDQTRKSTGRRIRKRKHVEVDHEPSPPVFRLRKGTRSRPNVKVPRYFNANFDNSAPAPTPEPEDYVPPNVQEEPYIDSYMNILEHIKTEPLDIEDGLISYEGESFNNEMTEQNVSLHLEEETQKVVKRRKLSRTAPEQEKLDPLKLDRVVTRRRRGRKRLVEKSDGLETSTEGTNQPELENKGDNKTVDVENSDSLPLENSDRLEVPIENSEEVEIPMEDSDEELRGFENVESGHSRLENTNATVLETDEMMVSNENADGLLENAINEGSDNIENSESQDVGYHEIRIEKSYTDETDEGKFHGFETVDHSQIEEEEEEEVDGPIEEPLASGVSLSADCSNTPENSDEVTNEVEETKIDEQSDLTKFCAAGGENTLSSENVSIPENTVTPLENNEETCGEETDFNTLINVDNTEHSSSTSFEKVNEAEDTEETGLTVLESKELNVDTDRQNCSEEVGSSPREFLTNSEQKDGAC